MPTANDRIFYACQGVAIQNAGKGVAVVPTEMIHGLQSVGVTTNFNLEQAFELGQIEIYENIEGTPDIEVTLEKVLDGDSLIYHLASTGVSPPSNLSSSGLVNRSKQRCDVYLGIFPEENNFISSAAALDGSEVVMTGMYISSIAYNLASDGNSTESVTLVGNNKQWYRMGTGGSWLAPDSVIDFNGNDEPVGLGQGPGGGSGVTQREDVYMAGCILPRSIDGVVGTGYDNASDRVHVQSISVSTDFSREDIFELGRKTPYARPAAFPIEVTCDIEAITTSGDWVEGLEEGSWDLYDSKASGNNTSDEAIFFYTRQGLGLDLGIKNRLSSVSYGGGDAGGGNATVTYSYQNFNDLDVQMRKSGYIGIGQLKSGTWPSFPSI